MIIILHFTFFFILCKIKCQQVLNEELSVSTNQVREKLYIQKAKIARRFLEDLDDHEFHIAHLRTAVFEGREDCIGDTFEDKAKRYKKMLKQDGARVEFVSADALPDPDPAEIVQESCKTQHILEENYTNTIKVTSAMLYNVTKNDNIVPPTVAQNVTTAKTTVSMKVADTTPNVDFKATTVKSKVKTLRKKKKPAENLKNPENDTLTRRADEEYIFSSEEYYDDSIELNAEMCPDVLEVIHLDIDQLRNYDLECERTLEWKSLT